MPPPRRLRRRKLRAAGIDAWRHDDNSITVVFPRPPDALIKKWVIAPKKKIAHLITLPPMNEAVIDEFVADMKELTMVDLVDRC